MGKTSTSIPTYKYSLYRMTQNILTNGKVYNLDGYVRKKKNVVMQQEDVCNN